MAEEKNEERNWYAIHTYVGHEEKVADSLRQRVGSVGLEGLLFDAMVPKEKTIEIKNGKRKIVEKKIFQGYVLVDMIVTKHSWYVVRNTPQVTGFIGVGTDPIPLSPDEVKNIQKRMGIEEPKYKIDLIKGDLVNITDGPFKGSDAVVDAVDEEKGKLKVLVSIFGRETSVELDSLQVRKV